MDLTPACLAWLVKVCVIFFLGFWKKKPAWIIWPYKHFSQEDLLYLNKLHAKMNWLYQIRSKILHGTKVIIICIRAWVGNLKQRVPITSKSSKFKGATQHYVKYNICNSTLIFRTPSHCHRFLQVLSHFRGFEPHPRRYFFLKSDIKWAFSYILIY